MICVTDRCRIRRRPVGQFGASDRECHGEADDGSRTRDLELGKLALYQLSYVRARPDSTGAPRVERRPAIGGIYALPRWAQDLFSPSSRSSPSSACSPSGSPRRAPPGPSRLRRLRPGRCPGSTAPARGPSPSTGGSGCWSTSGHPGASPAAQDRRPFSPSRIATGTAVHRPRNRHPRPERRRARFVREFGLSYPQLRDGDGEAAADYGTTGVPESFLVDPARAAAAAAARPGHRRLPEPVRRAAGLRAGGAAMRRGGRPGGDSSSGCCWRRARRGPPPRGPRCPTSRTR